MTSFTIESATKIANILSNIKIMDNKFTTTKERILQLIEYKGIAKEKFFKKIGMTYGNFKGEAKKTPLNSTAIENIFTEFPDVSLEWLLTGQGEMIKKGVVPANKQQISGDNNQMAGLNIGSNNADLYSEMKKQIENKDNMINNLIKHQEILLSQIDKLTNKLNSNE